MIHVGQSLISDFDFGEIKSAHFGTRSTNGQHSNGHETTNGRAIDLTGSQTRTHTPNVLQKNISIITLALDFF